MSSASAAPSTSMGSQRVNLKQSWRSGEIDKTTYGLEMRTLHGVLEEYSALLGDSRLHSIRILPDGVLVESGWAPVLFHANFGDIGTPISSSLDLGDYEPLEMELIARLIADARVFFDVGANVGWYSVHAAALNPALRVVAFEPVAGTFAELERNIALNRSEVTAIRLALADTIGTAQMQVPPGLAGASSLHISRSFPGQEDETVQLSTLDTVAAELDVQVDVLKVDVEGAEQAVLEGGRKTLEANRPAVIAELLRLHSAAFGYHPNDVITSMQTMDYECFAASSRGWQPFGLMDEATVETNFAFLHPARHAQLIGELAGS